MYPIGQEFKSTVICYTWCNIVKESLTAAQVAIRHRQCSRCCSSGKFSRHDVCRKGSYFFPRQVCQLVCVCDVIVLKSLLKILFEKYYNVVLMCVLHNMCISDLQYDVHIHIINDIIICWIVEQILLLLTRWYNSNHVTRSAKTHLICTFNAMNWLKDT